MASRCLNDASKMPPKHLFRLFDICKAFDYTTLRGGNNQFMRSSKVKSIFFTIFKAFVRSTEVAGVKINHKTANLISLWDFINRNSRTVKYLVSKIANHRCARLIEKPANKNRFSILYLGRREGASACLFSGNF